MFYIFIAYLLRLGIGEMRWLPQPAAAIDWMIKRFENFLKPRFRNLKAAGAVLAILVGGVSYIFAKFFIWDLNLLHPALKGVASIILIYLALSMKGIKKERLAYQIDAKARGLDKEQLINRNVESIAENTVSGIISVLFYVFIAGPALLWVYKAVNILYLKMGHKNSYNEIGWFWMKLDKAFNYIPARLSLLIIPFASYIISRKNFISAFKVSFKEGINHPLSNSGIAQAAFANVLGCQLGGLSYWEGLPVHMPYVGPPDNPPGPQHIKKAIKLMYVSSAVMIISLIIVNYIWNVL